MIMLVINVKHLMLQRPVIYDGLGNYYTHKDIVRTIKGKEGLGSCKKENCTLKY